ncbi:MAG: uracil-DNA glycosylase family protein [Pirellulales bacterium]
MSKSHRSRPPRVAVAIQRLESLELAGVRQLGRPRKRAEPTEPGAAPAKLGAQPGAAKSPAAAAPSPAASAGPNGASAFATRPLQAGIAGAGDSLFDAAPPANDSLAVIQQEVAACRLCDELANSRTQTVFGVGNPHARLCFLGEAPGADEDRQGEPFVGRAGQLLTKIIEACTFKRSDVYILNVLKCRPPSNRTPLPHEVANCRGFLDRQLALIKPEFLCCLGAVAAQTLLQTDTPIGRMRGKMLDYRGIRVVCTYHPAYLLRNPAAKKDCWDDMKLLLGAMGVTLP